jgi:hypothetical protein
MACIATVDCGCGHSENGKVRRSFSKCFSRLARLSRSSQIDSDNWSVTSSLSAVCRIASLKQILFGMFFT